MGGTGPQKASVVVKPVRWAPSVCAGRPLGSSNCVERLKTLECTTAVTQRFQARVFEAGRPARASPRVASQYAQAR